MKRILTLFLLLTMIIALCACGKKAQASEQQWSLQQAIDEFGDVATDADSIIITPILGTFENAVTKDEKLEGQAFFQIMPGNTSYTMGFHLLEQGNIDAKYSDNDEKTLKVKIDDDIYEFQLSGQSPSGNLLTSSRDLDSDGDWLLDHLYHGQDLRCIIYIGSSKYTFSILSGNLPKLMESENLPDGTALMEGAYQKAVLLYDNGDYKGAKTLFEKLGDFNDSKSYYEDIIKNNRELLQSLQGKWRAIAGFARHSSYSYYAFDTDNLTFTLYWDNGTSQWTKTCDFAITGENTFKLKNLSEFEDDFGTLAPVNCTLSEDGEWITTSLPCCNSRTCLSPSTHNGHARFFKFED